MLTPMWTDGQTEIYHGDAMEILRDIHFDTVRVNAVITDPPYNVRCDDITLAHRSPMKRDFGDWDEGWQAEPFIEAVSGLVVPGGSLLSFTSDRLLSSFRAAEGWHPRGTIVWEKTNPAPHPRPAYVSATEWIVWMQRDGAAATWNGGGYVPNILRFPICSQSERVGHPTQKPEDLIVDLILRHTKPNDLILDPFMGSGTTLAAAKRVGRRAIGIEMDARWCEEAVKRLAQAALPLGWV